MYMSLKADMISFYLLITSVIFTSEFIGNTSGAQSLPQAAAHSNGHEFSPNSCMFKNIVKTTQQIEFLKRMDIAEMLQTSVLDIHRLGYESFIANLLSQGQTAMENRNSQRNFQGKSLFQTSQGVHDFLEEIYNKSNTTISSACVDDTLRILFGIIERQKWVIPFLDSTGKPGPSLTQFRINFVGNYKQCRNSVAPPVGNRTKSGFKGNYCIVGALPKGIAPGPQSLFASLQIGACVPDTCTNTDLWLLINTILELTNMTSVLQPLALECRTDEREVTTATIMAIVMICIIVTFMILGTIYDLVVIQSPSWNLFKPTKEDILSYEPILIQPNGDSITEDQGTDIQSEEISIITKVNQRSNGEYSTFTKVLLAFSVYANGRKVLDTRQTPGSLSAIHGIRFLSMSWVVMGHAFGFVMMSGLNAAEFIPVLLRRWTFDVIVNALPSVDTFFTLSGLLTSYLTIKEMKKSSWKINWPLFYFHRFWRLTPPYMLVLLIVLGLQRFMGSGALWPNTQPLDKKFCEDSWWKNLLYINNFVSMDKACMEHAWYLANDMQFFVLSPLMLIPFYFHRLAGFACCIVFLLVTWITTGVLSSQHDWPPTAMTLKPKMSMNEWFDQYYIVPWCRIGPFVIGVMTGYILAVTNGGRHLRMRWWMVVLGWLVATASALAVVYGLRGDISDDNPSSVGVAALYNAVARSVWGACVCWVIVACVSGYGGPVNTILSWSPFVFLGRLTYMSYLIHPSLLTAFFQNMDSLINLNETNLVIIYLGLLVFVNMAAFVSMLALESPMIGLEKALIRKERRD